MIACPRYPFRSEAEAQASRSRGARSAVYRCTCGGWHKAMTAPCRRCGAPIVADNGRPPFDPATGTFHSRDCEPLAT